MPNYVAVKITITGEKEKVDQVVNVVCSKQEDGKPYVFDFNKIVPMPEELNIESGSRGEWGKRYLLLKAKLPVTWTEDDREFVEKFEKRDKDDFYSCVELGKKYLSNISKYGYETWWGWCSDPANWNTKWNSCSPEYDRINDNCAVYTFDTAWSFCFPVIEKLSKMFPDVEIEFAYSDEDASYNCGQGKVKNAKYIEEFYPDGGSNEAYQLYIELHPGSEEDLVYDPDLDTYRWIDQDNDCDEGEE